MPSRSKIKGNSFEREIADFLTAIYSERFIRAPGSGAYVGGSNAHRKQTLHEGQVRSFKGDIIPGESFPRMNVECKFYKDLPFHKMFFGHITQLEEWINQCMDASDEGDFNLIFIKLNRKGIFVMTPAHEGLDCKNHLLYSSKEYGDWVMMSQPEFWKRNYQFVQNQCKK